MLAAKNGRLKLSAGELDYIRFGTGSRVLVMIPGLGDGLKTVRGTALPFALAYRRMARDFTVYVFSRRRALAQGYPRQCELLAAKVHALRRNRGGKSPYGQAQRERRGAVGRAGACWRSRAVITSSIRASTRYREKRMVFKMRKSFFVAPGSSV